MDGILGVIVSTILCVLLGMGLGANRTGQMISKDCQVSGVFRVGNTAYKCEEIKL